MRSTSEAEEKRAGKVYVGGIPSHASKEDILQYFSKYGKIIDVKMFVKPQTGRPVSSRNRFKGYCIVEVDRRRTLERILEEKRHSFEGRMILCSVFKTGHELAQHNSERNLRRVIIKQVPANLPEPALKRLLEKEGGEVEVLFPFKTDCSAEYRHNMAQRKRLTYSVMFKSRESANQLVQLSTIKTSNGVSLVVERFLSNRSEGGQVLAPPRQASRPASGKREAASFAGYQTDRPDGSYTSLVKSHGSSRRRPRGMDTVASEAELLAGDWPARRSGREEHLIKPTSVKYYLDKLSRGRSELYTHTTDNIRLCVATRNPSALKPASI